MDTFYLLLLTFDRRSKEAKCVLLNESRQDTSRHVNTLDGLHGIHQSHENITANEKTFVNIFVIPQRLKGYTWIKKLKNAWVYLHNLITETYKGFLSVSQSSLANYLGVYITPAQQSDSFVSLKNYKQEIYIKRLSEGKLLTFHVC